MSNSLQVEFLGVDECPDLAADWAWLEARSEGSPFTSWIWVSTWIRCLPAHVRPVVCRVRDDRGLLALGLLVWARERLAHRVFGEHSICLHGTGDAQIDEITPEYVGLLVRKHDEMAGYAAFLDAISERWKGWRRIRIPATTHGELILGAMRAGMCAYCVRDSPVYAVDLTAIRASGKEYLQHLSKKTRSNVSQVLRAYRKHGELRVEVADTAAQGVAWLGDLRSLHERRWASKGKPGSFASPYFRAFHESLVAEETESGFVKLIRIRAGDLVVGYVYAFLWRGDCYYYNSGFNYGALPRYDSPGIAALHSVVEYGLGEGWGLFDFLAGEQDYKRRLATSEKRMHWIDVRPVGVRLRMERLASRLLSRGPLGVPLGQVLPAGSSSLVRA